MAGTVALWFRRKYSLPPSDPRFLDMTEQDMLADYWAHYYADRPNEREAENEDFETDLAQLQQKLTPTPPDDLEDISDGPEH